jgi:thiosulfate dehydrogenase [quinone] large subunit
MKKYPGLLPPEIAWAVLRIFLGLLFLMSGIEKWGKFDGKALTGTLTSWINGGGNVPSNPNLWYVGFLKGTVIPHAGLFAGLVTYGEILVGATLILGLLTSIVALIGAFMNANYYFAAAHTSASTQSVNALFIVVQLLFALTCVGQYYGMDHYLFRGLRRRQKEERVEIGSNAYKLSSISIACQEGVLADQCVKAKKSPGLMV